MQKLVIGIPTYNSAAIVDETLSLECVYWKEKNVDIYLYDSSTNNDTYDVYKKWVADGYDNLHYVKIDSEVHSNKKVYMLYKDLSALKKYDFIWMRRDYTTYISSTCDLLLANLDNDICLISISKNVNETSGVKLYTDKEEYALKYIANSTRYGDCVVNSSMMLEDIDWNYYEEKYVNSKTVNFSHVGLYYELVAKQSNVKICNLGIESSGYNNSKLKVDSFWVADGLDIWCTCWGELIDKLSEYYLNIYGALDISLRFFPVMTLIRYRITDILNLRNLWRNRKWAKRCMGENYNEAIKLALTPKSRVKKFVEKYNHDNQKNLNKFAERYNAIYIYGARKHGKNVQEQLKCKEKVKAFVTTELKAGEDTFEGKKVISFAQFKEAYLESDGIVVAAGSLARPEIVELLEYNGMAHNMYVSDTILGEYKTFK